ncbi:PREDICTED: uncharacterized protein LOC101292172 [Fragaria vesca subsp. vesca]
MEGKMMIAATVAWVGYMVINKCIWSPMKRGPNPIKKKENDDPPSLHSSSVSPQELKNDPTSLPSSSAEVSSSPPPPPPVLEYDVFLSFRGPDTRTGIVSHLCSELQHSGIKTFVDEEGLEPGIKISSNLGMAIKESRSAIVLLSPNYASSIWCLNELADIVHGLETRNTIVIPVFYNVEPRDVRHQLGSFKEAFIRHEQRYGEKVERWKAALTKVAELSGLELKKYGSDRQLVEGIVQCVCKKLRDLEIVSTGDFVEFEASRKAMVKVMKALKDDGLTPIGLYGMGGIGKTTLSKHVAAEAKRKGLFRHVLMAVVTHIPDLRIIQGTLADQLGVKLVEETDAGRAARLSREILSRNKILIILDDIWKRLDLSDIGIPSYKELQYSSSKVLLTTRILEVCDSMGSHPKIALNILSDKDSLDLLVKETRMSSEQLTVFNDVAMTVARECAGLPIAVVAIARALRDKEMSEWKEAAERLRSSQPSNLYDVVVNCIKLSYDQLTSEDAKLCFLLCCLFPEDSDIQIEELMAYGIGKGLFGRYDTLQDARTTCRSAVRSLISSSLLLATKHDGQVRMHDAIRDAAIQISAQSVLVKAGRGRQLTTWPKINADNGYCAISLMMNEIRELPNKLVCSKLKILLLQQNRYVNSIPESFLECLNELTVLDLSKTSISSLPTSFSVLNNLHTLYLDSCEKLSDVSVVGKLKKLEILSLRECCPEDVPEEIGHLTSLRMLDISESPVVKIASQVISCLRGLEELYMQCNFEGWRNEVEEAGKETNLGFDELTGLRYLHILKVGIPDATVLPKYVEIPPNWLYFDICISRDSDVRESTWKPHSSHDHSRTLTLSTTIHTLPEWFIDVVTEKTEKLQYRKCKDLDNILVEYDHGRLNELRHLSIIGPHEKLIVVMNADARDARDSNNAAFPKLEELHLFEVENINNLCVGKLPPLSLCKLKLLDVRKCYNLVGALLQSPLLKRLQYLEKLICEHMYGLEYVFGSGKTTTCERLQELRLCRLPELKKLWSGHAPHEVSLNLKILAVSGCKDLKNLFTSDMACCLSQLEDLWVHSCFSLDRIVEASEDIGKRNVIFPKLKNLVLEDLPRLRRLYSNSSGGPTSLEIKFPSLEYFYNLECPRFSPSPPNLHSKKQVQVNDIQHYSSLKKRLWENMELEFTIFEDRRRLWRYDVFLSFKGTDTRKSIVVELYNKLISRGIKTFMDDQDLEVGDAISPTVQKAIEGSRFAIVVLSPNYASSTWCLEELGSICESMEDNRVLPVFYYVDPLDVRHQKGSFGDAFTKYETSQHGDKVDTWRDVLKRVSNFSGWHTKNHKTERELVDTIVDSMCNKVVPEAIESTGDFQVFGATRQAMDEVMKALIDDMVTTVGVYGMGGVGKTTMVKHVAAQSCKKGIFHRAIIAVLSQIPDLRKIQDTLGDMLGFKFKEHTQDGRAARLHKEIQRRGNSLIILDDVWERITLPSIGIPSHRDLQKCNSKVLITTRRLHVCFAMKCQEKIALHTLSEDDSWFLFMRTARTTFESTTIESLARKVVRECGGLPIALISVAKALRDKDLKVWEVAVRRLEKSKFANLDHEDSAFEMIRSSYDYLKDEECKSFFLLCCLFPEDYDIPIEDLFKYAIGIGLFRDAETIEEARASADSVVRYLKDSSLLLDSEEDGCVKMHDVIRDTALQIAQSEGGRRFRVKAGCGVKGWLTHGLDEGCTVISLMRNEIRKLPEELLEILSMRDTKLEELPREVGNLTNLRMLDVTGGRIARIPSKLISRLQSLEELYLECGFWEWGSKVDGEGDEINAGFDEPLINMVKYP